MIVITLSLILLLPNYSREQVSVWSVQKWFLLLLSCQSDARCQKDTLLQAVGSGISKHTWAASDPRACYHSLKKFLPVRSLHAVAIFTCIWMTISGRSTGVARTVSVSAPHRDAWHLQATLVPLQGELPALQGVCNILACQGWALGFRFAHCELLLPPLRRAQPCRCWNYLSSEWHPLTLYAGVSILNLISVTPRNLPDTALNITLKPGEVWWLVSAGRIYGIQSWPLDSWPHPHCKVKQTWNSAAVDLNPNDC